MYTPNTYPLSSNEFVDTYGLFTLRNEKSFVFDVPKDWNTGKLSHYKGCKVKLTLICQKKYGNVLSIEPTKNKSENTILPVNLDDFEKKYREFGALPTWVTKKRKLGIELFSFLRGHNPIYIQKPKDWIKEFRIGSATGDFIIKKVESTTGKLKSLNGQNCLFVVTYNKGFKNGFMVLPLSSDQIVSS